MEGLGQIRGVLMLFTHGLWDDPFCDTKKIPVEVIRGIGIAHFGITTDIPHVRMGELTKGPNANSPSKPERGASLFHFPCGLGDTSSFTVPQIREAN